MRVAFAGTPSFAARALAALHGKHEIVLVLTQPDRPAGRGLRPTPSAVAALARSWGVPVEAPATLRDELAVKRVRDSSPDVMVVAAYGLLLPQEVLDIPRFGCLNIHASLLPRWRGAAPIQRAILAGDAETGVSIMRMEAGLDTGPVLLEKSMPIGARETGGTLTDALAASGAHAIVDALERLPQLTPHPQDGARATYAPKITKAEARIDWRIANDAIDRMVRAFDPAPGAETSLGGERLKVWAVRPVGGSGSPGSVLPGPANQLLVACGLGAVEVLTLQRAGGKRLAAKDFLRGHSVPVGATLGLVTASGTHN